MIAKIYFIINFTIYSLLTLILVNAYIITPLYVKSESEILRAVQRNIEQSKQKLDDSNHQDIILLIQSTNLYFKDIEQQAFNFRKDFYNLQVKKEKELNREDIQKLVDNNFDATYIYQQDILQLIKQFESNNKKSKENYVADLSTSFYNKYPLQKYLLIDQYIQKTLTKGVVAKSYPAYDEQLIDKNFNHFKNIDIYTVINKYNHVRQSNILDYTLVGMFFSIGRSVSRDNELDKDLSNALYNLKYNLLYDTDGIVGLMKKNQFIINN
jgi:hypothetical protein